eukprot:403366531
MNTRSLEQQLKGSSFAYRRTLKTPHKLTKYQTLARVIQNDRFRFSLFIGIFSSTYFLSLYKSRLSENKILRIGAAGSLTILLQESLFYCIDAINIRSKQIHENLKFHQMVKRIYTNDGIYGLYKGYTATFYSSTVSGYYYFYMYKGIKMYMKDHYQPKTARGNAMIYASASVIAEMLALMIYYPYEMIKVRFLTSNDRYGYKNVSDALMKIVKTDSVKGLYQGSLAYSLAFLGQYTIQMTIYESYIDYIIKKHGNQKFKESENTYIIKGSIMGALTAAQFTNCLEVVVVRQQCGSGESALTIFKNEGWHIFTKGIGAKMLLASLQSVTFFMSIHYFGKLFNASLHDGIEE